MLLREFFDEFGVHYDRYEATTAAADPHYSPLIAQNSPTAALASEGVLPGAGVTVAREGHHGTCPAPSARPTRWAALVAWAAAGPRNRVPKVVYK